MSKKRLTITLKVLLTNRMQIPATLIGNELLQSDTLDIIEFDDEQIEASHGMDVVVLLSTITVRGDLRRYLFKAERSSACRSSTASTRLAYTARSTCALSTPICWVTPTPRRRSS